MSPSAQRHRKRKLTCLPSSIGLRARRGARCLFLWSPSTQGEKKKPPKKATEQNTENSVFRDRLDKLENLIGHVLDRLPTHLTEATTASSDSYCTGSVVASGHASGEPLEDEHFMMGQCPDTDSVEELEITDNSVLEVPPIAQKFAVPIAVGDAIHNDLAKSAAYLMSNQLEETVLEEAGGKYPPPSNCTPLCCPKVNAPIWENLAPHTRSRDLKLQRIQKPLTQGLTAFIQTLTPANLTETQQDALALICNANFELNCLRKEQIKPDLNVKYSHLCKPATPVSKFLFGDDLTKRVKDLTEQQKAAAGVVRGQRKPYTRVPYHPYNAPGPSYRGTSQYHKAGWYSNATNPSSSGRGGLSTGNYNRPFLGQRQQRGRQRYPPAYTQTLNMLKQHQNPNRSQVQRRK